MITGERLKGAAIRGPPDLAGYSGISYHVELVARTSRDVNPWTQTIGLHHLTVEKNQTAFRDTRLLFMSGLCRLSFSTVEEAGRARRTTCRLSVSRR